MIKVIASPDFRELAPYQPLLEAALKSERIDVEYQLDYGHRLMLYNGVKQFKGDILHLHFVETSLFIKNGVTRFRKSWYYPDLFLATRKLRLVYTAHNLRPLEHPRSKSIDLVLKYTLARASAVIAHSESARSQLVSEFGMPEGKCTVIPHGDISVPLGTPIERSSARKQLGLDDEPICLVFGMLQTYKGTDELIEFWKRRRPQARLAIAGWTVDPSYGERLKSLTRDEPTIITQWGFQSDEQLKLWLSATDCMVINYSRIFTSGVACLARSWGVPLLVPNRLITIDLQEPHPSVFRYESLNSDFESVLARALRQPADYEAGAIWRNATAWQPIAKKTAEVYRQVLA